MHEGKNLAGVRVLAAGEGKRTSESVRVRVSQKWRSAPASFKLVHHTDTVTSDSACSACV